MPKRAIAGSNASAGPRCVSNRSDLSSSSHVPPHGARDCQTLVFPGEDRFAALLRKRFRPRTKNPSAARASAPAALIVSPAAAPTRKAAVPSGKRNARSLVNKGRCHGNPFERRGGFDDPDDG